MMHPDLLWMIHRWRTTNELVATWWYLRICDVQLVQLEVVLLVYRVPNTIPSPIPTEKFLLRLFRLGVKLCKFHIMSVYVVALGSYRINAALMPLHICGWESPGLMVLSP